MFQNLPIEDVEMSKKIILLIKLIVNEAFHKSLIIRIAKSCKKAAKLRPKIEWFSRKFFVCILALINIAPSLTVIINPLFFIMFLPVGIYAILTWPWMILKYIPDPFFPNGNLWWLTDAIMTDEKNIIFPYFYRWGIIDLLLLTAGLVIFLTSFSF